MKPFEFGKEFRLLDSTDFDYLRNGSKVISSKWLRAYYKPSRINSANCRIGFSISKKVGNAVMRNKIKRVFREEFRLSPFKNSGLDILVIVSPRAKTNILAETDGVIKLRGSFKSFLEKVSNDAKIN